MKHEITCFLDGKLLPLFDHLAEGFVWAEFQNNVDILLIFKHSVELNDMLMMQCLMNLDFGK